MGRVLPKNGDFTGSRESFQPVDTLGAPRILHMASWIGIVFPERRHGYCNDTGETAQLFGAVDN